MGVWAGVRCVGEVGEGGWIKVCVDVMWVCVIKFCCNTFVSFFVFCLVLLSSIVVTLLFSCSFYVHVLLYFSYFFACPPRLQIYMRKCLPQDALKRR